MKSKYLKSIVGCLLVTSIPSVAQVSFGAFSGFPATNQFSTNGATQSGKATFTDASSGDTGVVLLSYTSTYSNGFTTNGTGSNFFPNNPGAGKYTAQNGEWKVEFFTDSSLATSTSINNFTLGFTHLNDNSGGWVEDFFHDFKVNGVSQTASSASIAANHVYDKSLNAIGSANTSNFNNSSSLTFAGPVSTLTFQAGSLDASGNNAPLAATGSSPAAVGNGFRNSSTPGTDYVTVGVDTTLFNGASVVPEPSSTLLLGLFSIQALLRRRR